VRQRAGLDASSWGRLSRNVAAWKPGGPGKPGPAVHGMQRPCWPATGLGRQRPPGLVPEAASGLEPWLAGLGAGVCAAAACWCRPYALEAWRFNLRDASAPTAL